MNAAPILQLLGCLCGLFYGLIFTLSGSWVVGMFHGFYLPFSLEGVVTMALLPTAIVLLQRSVRRHLLARPDGAALAARYYRLEPLSYLVFAAGAAVLQWRMMPATTALTIMVALALALVQAAIYLWALGAHGRTLAARSEKYIAVLFLISGFSALIYQVVWQRTLFSTFGINSESVTVIVSVFMFGLGLGSLAGGYVQKKYPRHLLRLFLGLEILIGLFGLLSLQLIDTVSAAAGQTSTATLVLWVYLILAVPTLLMGATLPILVSWLEGYVHNIGKSVGLLYAFNTIGSAFAAFFTVQVLFVFGGLQAALLVAAACNLVTAWLIADAGGKIVRVAAPTSAPAASSAAPQQGGMSFGFVFILLAAIGYISLSQEILWFRLIGFMTANKPQVFGMMLAAFLVGIAAGSLRSKTLCENGRSPYAFLLGAVACATLVFYLSLPLIAWFASWAGKDAGVALAYVAVALVAFCTGGILPLLMHVGVTGGKADSAQAVSWLYFANIIGATLGPLVTGFILLDRYSLEANIVLLTVVTLVLLVMMLMAMPQPAAFKGKMVLAMVVLAAVGFAAHGSMFRGHLEKLQYASADYKPFLHVLENRSGILTVEKDANDIMYGNGIYDGRFNTDPMINTNKIDRALMIVNLHRKPRKMLEIGLSTGSWTKVIADHPLLEQLTVVEINKGYPALIGNYPDIKGILNNPKINFVYDDGRRWLRNHPDERFDFILMNTSYHWRSNMTNLLSSDFLRLARSRLAPGGVIYYNATGSPDVVRTAASVFKYVTMYSNFVAASDAPFDMSAEERRANLKQFPAFAQDDPDRNVMLQYLTRFAFLDWGTFLRQPNDLWITTDDNMAVEYKAAHANYH